MLLLALAVVTWAVVAVLWAVGVVGGDSPCVMWHGGEVVVTQMCVVIE